MTAGHCIIHSCWWHLKILKYLQAPDKQSTTVRCSCTATKAHCMQAIDKSALQLYNN